MSELIETTTQKALRRGGAGETSEVRKQTVSDIVRIQSGLLLEKPTKRISLGDTEKLIDACKRYLDLCAEHGLVPSFQGLAGVCGVSRIALYEFLKSHPDSESGIFLERCRTIFMSMRQSAVDRGAAAEAMSIFLAKNSYQGFADRVEIEPVQPQTPYQTKSDSELAQKYLADIPEE